MNKADRKHPLHLDYVRSQPCLICGRRAVPHHLVKGMPWQEKGGMGLKSHDKWTVPLCDDNHHKEVHKSQDEFEERHGIDLIEIARRLWDDTEAKRNT